MSKSQREPYTFAPVQWDESNYLDADDWLMDEAADEYEWLSQIAADLEEMLDDEQVDHLSDLQLTPDQYKSLDAIRNQTTEAPA